MKIHAPDTQKSCVLTIHGFRWDVRDPLLDRLANTHLEKQRERGFYMQTSNRGHAMMGIERGEARKRL